MDTSTPTTVNHLTMIRSFMPEITIWWRLHPLLEHQTVTQEQRMDDGDYITIAIEGEGRKRQFAYVSVWQLITCVRIAQLTISFLPLTSF